MKRRAQAQTEAFLKEVAPAIIASKTKEEVHRGVDEIAAIEQGLLKGLRTAAVAKKRQSKAAARLAARQRVQELLCEAPPRRVFRPE